MSFTPAACSSPTASPSGQPQMMYRDRAMESQGWISCAQAGTWSGCSFMNRLDARDVRLEDRPQLGADLVIARAADLLVPPDRAGSRSS